MNSTAGLAADAVMRDVEEDIALAAGSDAPVLVSGERGTGKGLVARMIHARSRRADGPFVPALCGHVPDSILAPALFGQAPGPFALDADRRIGALERAACGTVFLQEIGATSGRVQSRLRHFLETREVRPVGSHLSLPRLDVRIIASTRTPLVTHAADGRFDEVLYYRLNIVHIRVPPLRGRADDILALFRGFLRQFAMEACVTPPVPTDEVCERLVRHRWPGNIRELEQLARRLVERRAGQRLAVTDLPDEIANDAKARAPDAAFRWLAPDRTPAVECRPMMRVTCPRIWTAAIPSGQGSWN